VIGVIDAIGEGVHDWSVGARAGVGWFGGSCGYCRRCRRDDAFACENVHEISGVTRDGGYATHMTRRSACARRPRRGRVGAAALRRRHHLQRAPSYRGRPRRHRRHSWRRRPWASGNPVRGAAGLRTVAVNRGRDKEELARKLGASGYLDSAAQDPAKALAAMGGAKAILATVTDGKAMQAIAGGLGANGVMMVIGAVGPLTLDSSDLLGKRASVKGWDSGIARDSEDTLNFSQRNNVASMNEIYPLEKAQEAYERMLSGKARFRVVLKMDG
jgi:alcohol dehydrogenase